MPYAVWNPSGPFGHACQRSATMNSQSTGRLAWLIAQIGKRIWVRATLFSLGAVATALLAAVAGPYIPYEVSLELAADSVDHILNILATSMLAVTTFSLSIMVSAYASATSNITPRSTKLLIEDRVAQNTLSSFLGSFLFSIVGIIGLTAGLYNNRGRIILFAATLVVLVIVVAAMLRWIEQLGKFGRVGDTIRRVEEATLPAAEHRGRCPRLGGLAPVDLPGDALAIFADCTGYVQSVDPESLQRLAEEHGLRIHLDALPGKFVHPVQPLAHVDPPVGPEVAAALADAFTIGADREYEQDPRFGLIVLSEIASRALSPAVNDPGTAIEVIGAGMRVLLAYSCASTDRQPAPYDRLHAPDLKIADLFDDFFNPIARDGAGMIEVQSRLQSALHALARSDPTLYEAPARNHALHAANRADAALESPHDRALLQQCTVWLGYQDQE